MGTWRTFRTNVAADLRRVGITKRNLVLKLPILVANRGLFTLLTYRFGRLGLECRTKVLRLPLVVAYKILNFLAMTLSSSEISVEARIGPGALLAHFSGIVIGRTAVVGSNCTIFHGVTLGAADFDYKCPSIGNDVIICAGAKILGDIVVGNNVVVGANAVALQSVPDHCVVAGIPARVLKQTDEFYVQSVLRRFYA